MGIKFYFKVIGMIMKTRRAWWWPWSIILKVLKVPSLQCLYNVSKKKLWTEFIMEFIKIKTSTSWIIDFGWNPDMSKASRKGSFLSFCNILRKMYHNCFCVLLWSKTFRLFMGFQSCLLLLVFANIPTVPILPEQSRFLVCCTSVLD